MTALAGTSTFSLALRAPKGQESHWLEPGGQLWLGRHPTNDVVLEKGEVSRFHATIRWDADAERPVLRDVNSVNGTRVDGRRVDAQEPIVLHGGEQLSFAGQDFDVELVHEGVAAPALLTEDSSEVLLFTDQGPAVEGYVWNRDALLRRLLSLEDERRTGTFDFDDGTTQVQLTVCMGTIVSAACGELRGKPAVRELLAQTRGSIGFTRAFIPVEAELELSLREFLALEQDETRRMRRTASELAAEVASASGSGTLFTLNLDELWGGE